MKPAGIKMLPNAFIGRAEAPTDAELAAELGRSKKALWDQLVSDFVEEYHIDQQEWNSYSPKAGWSLRLKKGKRNIVYLSPRHGSFQVAFILGDRAMTAARESGLPPSALAMLNEATRYAEGTAVRLDVTGRKDLATIRKLGKIKLGN